MENMIQFWRRNGRYVYCKDDFYDWSKIKECPQCANKDIEVLYASGKRDWYDAGRDKVIQFDSTYPWYFKCCYCRGEAKGFN